MRIYCGVVSVLVLATVATATVAGAQQSPPAPPARTPRSAAAGASTGTLTGTSAGTASPVARRVEAYLRNVYALGPKFTVKVGEPKPTAVPGMRAVSIEVITEGQTSALTMFVSDDGRYLLQGDLSDMQADPFAKNRAEMNLAGAPGRGPENARILVVEYGDFQCPSCRRLSEVLRPLYADYPQVRFVFRDFPLVQIHPWALTASLAGRCIYHKDPAAFWTYSDYIYDHQDKIAPESVWNTVVQQGLEAGYDEAGFKACMADPAMKDEVEKSMAEGVALKIANTPTVFINGRRLVGGDRETVVQFIDYEIAQTAKTAKP